jgi:hypothetical protein
MSQTVAVAASTPETATDILAEELLEEVFEHADRFIGHNDRLNNWAIFQWLAKVERENGLVSEATIGTRGSKWLLARELGDTLQTTVNHIVNMTAAEHAMQEFTLTFIYASFAGLWNMNDDLLKEGPLADLLKPDEYSGIE